MSHQMSNADFEKVKAEKIADAMLIHNPNRLYQTLHRSCSCGYTGARNIKARTKAVTFVFLFLCGFVPGLIYWLAHRGHDYVCPRCGAISSKWLITNKRRHILNEGLIFDRSKLEFFVIFEVYVLLGITWFPRTWRRWRNLLHRDRLTWHTYQNRDLKWMDNDYYLILIYPPRKYHHSFAQ